MKLINLNVLKDINKLVFNKIKCPRCGCTGIHACMGDTLKIKSVDMASISKYNTLEEAIEHIRRSEAKQRLQKRMERRNGKPNRGS